MTPSREVQRAVERRADFFTCDPATQLLVRARAVNPENSDGFPGLAAVRA